MSPVFRGARGCARGPTLRFCFSGSAGMGIPGMPHGFSCTGQPRATTTPVTYFCVGRRLRASALARALLASRFEGRRVRDVPSLARGLAALQLAVARCFLPSKGLPGGGGVFSTPWRRNCTLNFSGPMKRRRHALLPLPQRRTFPGCIAGVAGVCVCVCVCVCVWVGVCMCEWVSE